MKYSLEPTQVPPAFLKETAAKESRSETLLLLAPFLPQHTRQQLQK